MVPRHPRHHPWIRPPLQGFLCCSNWGICNTPGCTMVVTKIKSLHGNYGETTPRGCCSYTSLPMNIQFFYCVCVGGLLTIYMWLTSAPLFLSNTHTHVHTHTHTLTNTYTNTQRHTHVHTRTCTHIHTHTHSHTHTYLTSVDYTQSLFYISCILYV